MQPRNRAPVPSNEARPRRTTTGSVQSLRTRERAVLAAIFAALLFAGAPRVAQSEECLSATEAANALRCDEHQAALAATKLCSEASPAAEAGGTVSGSAGERIARAACALPRTARATGSPALHTATPARPLHRHPHRGLAMRHASRRHATPELHAHQGALRPAGNAPAPSAPARENHPRAALPVLVRPAHQVSSGGGWRLAAALPRASATLAVSTTSVAPEENVHALDPGHEANEARGPPRSRPIASIPPFARRTTFPPRARSSRTQRLSFPAAPPPPEADRGVPASRASSDPARDPVRRSALPFVVTAPPLGGAAARRMESATACPSWLSSGGGT